MLILLIDNENICTDTNFIDLKNIFSFLDIGKSLLLGNVLILCIFFCKIPDKSQAHLKTRGPGALKLVNSIAKYQLKVYHSMDIYALNCIIMKIKYV